MSTPEQVLPKASIQASQRGILNPVVVDTAHSPHARLRPVALTAVTLQDTFWTARRAINRRVMIPAQYNLCERTGRIDNFRRAAGTFNGPFQGMFFNDSDVYKLLEAAAWQLADGPDAELEALIDGLIGVIAAAQQPDGYLNTYFMFEREYERWTNFDLHEMYCAGHLFQAAVAHYRVTGKTTLLDVAVRLADHICARFGPEAEGKHFGTDGHPEVEMALVELYRVTHNEKYLNQARYFIAVRGSGRLGKPFGSQNSAYHQDRVPFSELTRLEGHAVRAVYLNCGAADVIAETDDPAIRTALDRMWHTMTTRQMYVHGGLGSRYETEGMGRDFELPNSRAYAETCASVANFMWNWRMLMLDGDSRYADLLELALYNSALSGASLDGHAYFYQIRSVTTVSTAAKNGSQRRVVRAILRGCWQRCPVTCTALPSIRCGFTCTQAALSAHRCPMVRQCNGRSKLITRGRAM